MSSKIRTAHGYAIPPAPRHSVTVHMPGWDTIVLFAQRDPVLMNSFNNMYPRVILHKDIKELSKRILECSHTTGQGCLLFSSPDSAAECRAYGTSVQRGEHMVPQDEVSIRRFRANTLLHAIFFPSDKLSVFQPFWMNAGVGISSRLAESNLQRIEDLHEAHEDESLPETIASEAHRKVCERLADMFERAPISSRTAKVSPNDVFLFPTGMAAIYSVHKYLLNKHARQTVLFGFAFSSTIRVFEDFGPGCRFFGLGASQELNELEQYLDIEYTAGRSIQAVWAEFPSNPLLYTPDLNRLRELADKYSFVLIIDDTISSVCNVDLLGAADIVVTSLTKSFSGYADVMAGGAVLNPSSSKYSQLSDLFRKYYKNDYYVSDAQVLESNSRDYLARSKILNNNAASLVKYLQSEALRPKSSIATVFYPNISPSSNQNYQAYMRPATADFTPGHGCLLSVEFKNAEATIEFYENLNVHKGPHLGAHLTLAFPYAKGVYGKELEWAGKYNLRDTQIRVAVGLEDEAVLLEEFKIAVIAADAAWNKKS